MATPSISELDLNHILAKVRSRQRELRYRVLGMIDTILTYPANVERSLQDIEKEISLLGRVEAIILQELPEQSVNET